MAKDQKKGFPWGWVFGGVFLFIGLISFIFIVIFISFLFGLSKADFALGNVAVIPVKGVIAADDIGGIFGSELASSKDIVEMIKDADSDSGIKAIIFEINSPGGSPVATDEISQAILNTNKTTVAWIRDVGASGAYWIASSCDTVVANRMSIVGSIGVIGSYLDFSGMINRYNVSYERLVAGEHKDIGSPFRSLTEEERGLLQEQLDGMHDIFIIEIANNRDMSVDEVKKLADGMFYIGAVAKKKKLVDILGGEEEAVDYIEDNLDIEAELVYYHTEKGLLDVLSSVMQDNSYNIGKGIGSALTKTIYTNSVLI